MCARRLKDEARWRRCCSPARFQPTCRARTTGRPDAFAFVISPWRLRLNGTGPPQHIRLDQALETLIGDRLR